MKQIKILILVSLVLAIVVGCFTSCEMLKELGIDVKFELPFGKNDNGDNGEDNSGANDQTGNTEDEVKTKEEIWASTYDCITIAKALELCEDAVSAPTSEKYYIIATVVSVDNPTFGQMTIEDSTGRIMVYGTYSVDDVRYDALESKPVAGDKILILGNLQNYGGEQKEVKKATLIDFEHVEVVVDDSDYTAMTVAEAREAEKGALIKTTGVVARITYANGYIPSGFYLIDSTNSIYVYDGQLAAMVKEGNTVTILGTKDYWILDSEMNNAAKFGYEGCCQLTDAVLVSSDNLVSDFNKSWITETTVKELLNTPVTDNITTTIYKVNALVSKAPGSGFVNYYFNDLDGTTGSYAYTQCNGGDFKWLDEFDGKICTVYISAINAKSTSSDCFFRFIPIAVIDEGYVFNTDNTASFVVEYYGKDQFLSSYTGDPALELVTSVSSELLGFENATLSYTSSNTDAITISTTDGKTVMNCVANGKSTITITATYGDTSYSEDVEIVVLPQSEYDCITVADAIASSNSTEVIIKGIVGPSLVNQSGFYLIDDSGVIAVLINAEVFDTIEVGYEVVIKGTKDVKTKGGTSYFGQTYINNGELLANYYGNHEYSTDSFGEITPEEFYNLDATVDYSTSVFVMTGTVVFTESTHSTNVNIKGESSTISLYHSSASQYSWLRQFEGQTVTLEIAACNWNSKTYWRGCVIAVILEDGTKIVNTLNFN